MTMKTRFETHGSLLRLLMKASKNVREEILDTGYFGSGCVVLDSQNVVKTN